MEHRGPQRDILPTPGEIYSAEGPNAGQKANPENPYHYPVESVCHAGRHGGACGCGQVIRREQWLPASSAGDWQHTGRRPGDAQ